MSRLKRHRLAGEQSLLVLPVQRSGTGLHSSLIILQKRIGEINRLIKNFAGAQTGNKVQFGALLVLKVKLKSARRKKCRR